MYSGKDCAAAGTEAGEGGQGRSGKAGMQVGKTWAGGRALTDGNPHLSQQGARRQWVQLMRKEPHKSHLEAVVHSGEGFTTHQLCNLKQVTFLLWVCLFIRKSRGNNRNAFTESLEELQELCFNCA